MISITEAANHLWNVWQSGEKIEALPEAIRPKTDQEGFSIQLEITRRAGDQRFGWKIAATSSAGQKHIGVSGPLPGTLLAARARTCPAQFSLTKNAMRVAEAEFAFRMARDLPPRGTPYTQAEVLAAVDTLHPAIEVPDSRFREFTQAGAAQLIADNACADYFALAKATTTAWRDIDLSKHPVRAYVNDKLAQEGSGANVLGDPRIALTWLANQLCSFGSGLKAGEVVTTGTSVVPVAIAPGDRVVADFGVLGTAEVSFAA